MGFLSRYSEQSPHEIADLFTVNVFRLYLLALVLENGP